MAELNTTVYLIFTILGPVSTGCFEKLDGPFASRNRDFEGPTEHRAKALVTLKISRAAGSFKIFEILTITWAQKDALEFARRCCKESLPAHFRAYHKEDLLSS